MQGSLKPLPPLAVAAAAAHHKGRQHPLLAVLEQLLQVLEQTAAAHPEALSQRGLLRRQANAIRRASALSGAPWRLSRVITCPLECLQGLS